MTNPMQLNRIVFARGEKPRCRCELGQPAAAPSGKSAWRRQRMPCHGVNSILIDQGEGLSQKLRFYASS